MALQRPRARRVTRELHAAHAGRLAMSCPRRFHAVSAARLAQPRPSGSMPPMPADWRMPPQRTRLCRRTAPASAGVPAPVLAEAARPSAALPLVLPGARPKQAAAAAWEARRWATTIASAEAVELEVEAPPSQPASPQPCRIPATRRAARRADCSIRPQQARVGSPCFDLSNLS